MKKANPKAVGGFVIVAVILALAAVVVFGTGRFFETRKTYVAFFPGSLMGLNIGAPVEMRGIQIGIVNDTWVEADKEGLDFTIPVLMEVELSRIRGVEPAEEGKSNLDELIDRGFRAQMVSQSLVTGQQSIQLNFHPDTPVNLSETDLPYLQIPTIPSRFSVIEGTFENVAKKAEVVLTELSDLLSDKNRASVAETLENIELTTQHMTEMRDKVTKFLDNADGTLAAVKSLAENADGILTENRPGIKKAVTGLAEVEDKIGALADTAQGILKENRKGLKDFSNEGLYEITNFAVDAQATAEQLRRVLEEMERDPARFFLGKPGQVEVQ
jgi:paraquat-inducible protein B